MIVEDAVGTTNGTVTSVTAAVNYVLGTASSLSYGNYQALAAMGDYEISSAQTWNDYDWSETEGGEYCSDEMIECMPPLASMFLRFNFWRKAKIVGDSDLVGCTTAGAATIYAAAGGPVFLSAIAGACGIWGLGASAAAAVALQ